VAAGDAVAGNAAGMTKRTEMKEDTPTDLGHRTRWMMKNLVWTDPDSAAADARPRCPCCRAAYNLRGRTVDKKITETESDVTHIIAEEAVERVVGMFQVFGSMILCDMLDIYARTDKRY
jgi:hypothetical protein